jgi:hypothetical protein
MSSIISVVLISIFLEGLKRRKITYENRSLSGVHTAINQWNAERNIAEI